MGLPSQLMAPQMENSAMSFDFAETLSPFAYLRRYRLWRQRSRTFLWDCYRFCKDAVDRTDGLMTDVRDREGLTRSNSNRIYRGIQDG
jgi:hypothetical protein